jgi:hypothetical protein
MSATSTPDDAGSETAVTTESEARQPTAAENPGKVDREQFAKAAVCPDCELGDLCNEHEVDF